MRFSTTQHPFYGGLDRQARSMYLCILHQEGEVLLPRNRKAAPEPFLKAIAPYREAMVVCVACLFTWDLARRPLRPGGAVLRSGPGPLHAGEPRGPG
jgi:hypothetical protein